MNDAVDELASQFAKYGDLITGFAVVVLKAVIAVIIGRCVIVLLAMLGCAYGLRLNKPGDHQPKAAQPAHD